MQRSTEQESFWEGEFGNQYTLRNRGNHWTAANLAFFSKVLARTHGINNVLELGSNIGLNLMALRQLLPNSRLSAVEINANAVAELVKNVPGIDLHQGSVLDFVPSSTWDLVFTKGLLVHIHPDRLPLVYDVMHRSSSRYLMVSESYNPNPTEINYRGHEARYFKRDFPGELMARFSDLKLCDYGFVYKRDPVFPQDDTFWFLLEKVSP